MKKEKNKVIDLFCGCGGLSHGFIEAGYEVVLGVDYWSDAISTFKKNHVNVKGLVADLLNELPEQISKKTGIENIDLIIGGPPCQGFSIAGKRIIEDERNKLYKAFVGFVEYFEPKAFLMENVPNIVSMGSGAIKDAIVSDFENLGYKVVYKVLMASDYGVPQNRKRAFFLGIKGNVEFVFPKPMQGNYITSQEAISDLPKDSVADGSKYQSEPNSEYQKAIRKNSNAVFNHETTKHSEQTVSIIDLVPDGGNYKNLPQRLQQTRNVNIAWTRLNSNKPSFTIDTGHRHHFHYKFNRVPTVRESARIQSFPDTFQFLGSKTSQYKQVGNAVPPLLAKVIAEELKKYL
ncbi:MAG: DNA cytosine methyltransferase [Pseudomonadota bacterium]